MLRNEKFEKHKIDYVEQNLASYRANKKNKEQIQKLNTVFFTYFTKITNFICLPNPIQYILPERNNILQNATYMSMKDIKKDQCSSPKNKNSSFMSEHTEEHVEDVDDVTFSSILGKYTVIDWVILSLQIILWLMAWKIFIIMEFGAIFFLLSCFAFIWFNLNSGGKRKGLSAYSVFNPNCEQITGSFTAEKFEKELLHR